MVKSRVNTLVNKIKIGDASLNKGLVSHLIFGAFSLINVSSVLPQFFIIL